MRLRVSFTSFRFLLFYIGIASDGTRLDSSSIFSLRFLSLSLSLCIYQWYLYGASRNRKRERERERECMMEECESSTSLNAKSPSGFHADSVASLPIL